jgi:hypothetical protein
LHFLQFFHQESTCSDVNHASAILFVAAWCLLAEYTGMKQHTFAIYLHYNISLQNIITLSLFLCVLLTSEVCIHFWDTSYLTDMTEEQATFYLKVMM